MNVNIFNWCREREVNDVLAKLGYAHNTVVDGDPHNLAKVFFDAGLNVMLVHGTDMVLLALDTKSFQQR